MPRRKRISALWQAPTRDGDICTYTASGTVLNCNTAPSAGAVVQLAQTVISGSSTASIPFSTISGSYTQLKMVLNVQSADVSSDQLEMRFNGDSGSNYDTNSIYQGSGSASGAASNSGSSMQISGGAPTVASRSLSMTCDFPNPIRQLRSTKTPCAKQKDGSPGAAD